MDKVIEKEKQLTSDQLDEAIQKEKSRARSRKKSKGTASSPSQAGSKPAGASPRPAGKKSKNAHVAIQPAIPMAKPSLAKPGSAQDSNGNGPHAGDSHVSLAPDSDAKVNARLHAGRRPEERPTEKSAMKKAKEGPRAQEGRPKPPQVSQPAARTKEAEQERSGQGQRAPLPSRKREFEAERGAKPIPRKKEEQMPSAKPAPAVVPEPEQPKEIVLPEALTVRELAALMHISPIDVIKELMNNGIMANINQVIDFDTAAVVATELGFTVIEEKPQEEEKEEEQPKEPKTLRELISERADQSQLERRPPVVTVLGHVDHGKTTLLDAIRHTAVADSEAGGITQRIGAYQVDVGGQKITFLDTPGHEAFTAMRARGAQVTDLAVLVVAADDGVMPQTKEAIDHARAAHVPILVALNKIDKPNANPDLVKQQLADIGLVVEEWGGDVICVPISAKLRKGIDELLENILLVTEVADLKANPHCPAVGTVIESRLDKSKGVVATLLVQNGTLHVGDNLVVGELYGRVRAMFDDKGQPVEKATPSMPVAVLGLPDVPPPGEIFEVFESEHEARAKAEERAEARRAAAAQPAARVLTLDDISRQIKAGKIKELNVVLKADVQGSIEPIINSLSQLGDEELRVKILHAGTGNISESDVMLAAASQAIVVGFAVEPDGAARKMAEQEGVDIRLYQVIYDLVQDMDQALRGLLEPKYQEIVTAHAEVRQVFRISKVGHVAGCYVTDGTVTRDARVRVFRNGEKVHDGTILSLKRFKEDVKEVPAGFECGIAIEQFDKIEQGDILEFYKKERVS